MLFRIKPIMILVCAVLCHDGVGTAPGSGKTKGLSSED